MRLDGIITTYRDGEEHRKKFCKDLTGIDEVENEVLNIYPQFRYQTIEGFGGALTDSAAYVYSLMDEQQKKELIEMYFGEGKMGYQLLRIPIDSCDFSLEQYEASSKEEQGDFSLARAKQYIMPMFEDIKAVAGDNLRVMLTPWSPPAFMKTNGKRTGGGKLKADYYQQWAAYICRYIKEFQLLGIPVTSLSVQNEPKAIQTWDSCIFTAEEERSFILSYLAPELQRNQLDIKLYIWDHNKERALERAEAIIDEETDSLIAGVAVHWYSGDHFEALQMIHERYPDKEIILSEACIEYSKYGKEDYLENAKKYAHDLIGNLRNGLTGFYDWNLILDEKGGPNHVGNYCAAPYLYDEKKRKLMGQNTLAYLWHFCHFIQPGAVRIGSSIYTDQLEVVAFACEGKYVFVLLNRTGNKKKVNLRIKGEMASFSVPAEAICSGVISP